ncbi:MAG: carboxypeptidase regulatory-like domain-containing protein [Clostridia bacterium]|nr:carboxypeptidase regulatory-like domain-containing protein [Clostridia bacterium]
MGKIVVNTRYANSASPTGASVVAVFLDGDLQEKFETKDGSGMSKELPLGEYSLSVVSDGFFEAFRSGVAVNAGGNTLITIQLFPLYSTQKGEQYERQI